MFSEARSANEQDDLRKGRASLDKLRKLTKTDKNSDLPILKHFENPPISIEN